MIVVDSISVKNTDMAEQEELMREKTFGVKLYIVLLCWFVACNVCRYS